MGDARESIRKKGVNAVILKGEGTGSLGLRGTSRFKTGEIQFIKACVGHTFLKFAFGQVLHTTLNCDVLLSVELISWIGIKVCDLWRHLPKMNNPTLGL